MAKKTAPQVQHAASTHARFFDLSLELLVTANVDGYFVDLNMPWSSTLGYTLDELRQKPFVDFVHPADKEATIKETAKLLAGEITVHFENRYRHKDGTWRWLAWTARLSQEDSLIFACARDITPSKSLLSEKEQVLSEQERFRALAENTTDFVGMCTVDGRATYLNPAGKRLLGAPNLEVETLSIADCHPPRFRQRLLKEGLPQAAAVGVWTSDGELRTQKGATIPISQVIVPLRDGQGQLVGYGTIIRDFSVIEHLKKLEHELRTQKVALREALHSTATPLIPITDQVVVIPLIGTMDARRNPQLVDTMLRSVEQLRARVVIIDATELRSLESSTATLLMRTAAVLGLLGAQVALSGFRPETARTLLSQGVKLSYGSTHSTLQSGIAYALSATGAHFAEPRIAEPAKKSERPST